MKRPTHAIYVILLTVLLGTLPCGTSPVVSPPVTSVPAETKAPIVAAPSESSTPLPPTTAPESPTPRPPDLEILSHTSYTDAGWYHVVGEVRNNTSLPMEYVKIVVTLYDDAGTVVSTDFTYTVLDIIPPGDKLPFQTGSDQWQGATNYKLQVQGREGSLPRQDLAIQGDRSYSEGNWLHIRGEVVNTGSPPAEYVKIVATLYDAAGSVVGSDFTYTSLDMIPAGGNSPFETGTDHWPGFDHCELHVQGR